ncbi:TonB-dependent receptor [Marinomonas polaris]|uniref:TonB-dependent receptor n=1 Tax=Marinomonas polaris TaxID=293552 RepID=UPI003F956380
MKQKTLSKIELMIGALALLPVSVLAQEDTGQKSTTLLPELMVTADKKQQTLSKATSHATVYDTEVLQQDGVDSLAKLEGRVAGLSFQPFGQSGINSPVIRGLTANFNALSSSTLLMVDGVPTLTAQGFENNLVDIDRVEVLRGPQSTVYGRNAEVGVVSIFSNDLVGEDKTILGVEVGSRDKQRVQLSTSQTLVEDEVYISLSGEFLEQDGFIDNATTGNKADDKERQNLNAGLRWLISNKTDVVVRYRRQAYDDGAMLWGSPSGKRATVASATDSWNHSVGQTFSINANHELPSGVRLNSVTAYNDYRDKVQQDTDFQPAESTYIGRDHHLRTLSQEFRLEGNLGEADWLFGAYLERQDHDLRTLSKTFFGLSDLQAQQTGNSYAFFTNWTMPISSDISVIAGIRASRDEVKLNPSIAQEKSESWTDLTPQLTLKYDINSDHMLYASYAEGIRSGGFNTVSPAVNYSSYDPEKNQSFELGLKGDLSDKPLRYTLSAYHMDIKNMQVSQMPTVGLIYLTNAADATSDGLEASLEYYFNESWSTEIGVAWNKTRFDRFIDGNNDYSGNRNPFAPEMNGHLSLRYEDVGGWSVAASLVGSSAVYLDAANKYQQKGYELVHVSASYPLTDKASLSAYVNNLQDRQFDAVGYQNGYVTVYSPPREYGVKFTLEL